MLILGIETSCDETAVSVVKFKNNEIDVLSNIVSSQVKLHAKWGGVVPNLAAREHLKNILPVLEKALAEAKVSKNNIDLIAVTIGPGLIPALLIGTNAAKTLAYVWEKPLLGIHHVEGHIYANFVGENSKFEIRNLKFPILCPVVSGGHTQLILMRDYLKYEIVGETLDDAAGEAFDKVARILNVGYPGGPAIAQRAMKSQITNYKIILPRPMINKNNFNFSFSGLKTAVLYETKKHPTFLKNKNYIAAMCREFQQAIVDVLINKTIRAAKKYNPKTIMLAGGVAANVELRKQLGKSINQELKNTLYIIPEIKYTGDNATMIAVAAYYRWNNLSSLKKERAFQNWKTLEADANFKLK